jgi:CMP/dCMP kinase
VKDTAAGTGRPGLAADHGMVIAVDGPSGSGKSTAARGTALALGLRYLDTGAMYRAVTWWMLEHNIDLTDVDSVVKQAARLRIEVGTDPHTPYVRVDGVDVTAHIRSRQVSNSVSGVAAIPQIRVLMRAIQQQIIWRAKAEAGGIVAEGRDIGTVVAPDANVKVFLTASEQARAERRAAELADRQIDTSTDVTRREQATRDRLDAPQTQRAADAVVIDATALREEDVVARIVALAGSKRAQT